MRKILVLLLGFIALQVQAQTPVQVNAQLLPPYSLQVSDYYSPTATGGNKLNLILLNRDFLRATINVRLRMVIESQGIRISTKESVSFPTVTLVSGSPYYVSPSELSAYFNAANLDFSGISQEQYTTTGKLPEGFYTFCFETVEPTTGLTISNKGCAFAWMTLSDPPFLNIPSKAETVTPINPQNINFQWTPRHTASPNAGYNTDYVFSITEVQQNDMSPESAFGSHQALYIDSTQATTYNYGPDKPQLIAGKRYAWRIQAKAKQGNDNLAMFKNYGYSEVFWFDYKNNCTPPLNITATVQGTRVVIEWQAQPIYLGYKVDYREKNNPSAEWFSVSNVNPSVVINDLNFSKEYEYRVGAACEEESFNFSTLRSFTTGAVPVPPVENCGDSSNIPSTVAQDYITNMLPGDTITAGDFKVIITDITGSTNFVGKGYVKVPWLLGIKVAVRFNNIKVNTAKRLAEGKIETTYDPAENGILDIDDIIDIFVPGQGVGGVITGAVTGDTTFNFTIQWPGGITATTGPGFDPITGTGPVTITVTPVGGGPSVTYTVQHLPTTLVDSSGNVYQVNNPVPPSTTPTVTLLGTSGGKPWLDKTNKKLLDADKAIVSFVNYNVPKVTYAFDEWNPLYKKSLTFNKEYERIKCTAEAGDCMDEGAYYVSAKAIAPGKTDYIKAVVTIKDNTINPDSIRFVNGKGTIYNKVRLDSGSSVIAYEIAVVGGPEKDAQEIYALYPKLNSKTFNLGKVLVASYPQQQLNIKLVKVNGELINISALQDSLSKIYSKLNIEVKVTIDDAYNSTAWDLNNDGNLDTKGSNDFANYTSEMKALRDGFKSTRNTQNEFYYIFLMKSSNETANLAGEMLRNKRYGFLFTDKLKTNSIIDNGKTARILAHEMGHGAFQLKHLTTYGFSNSELQDNVLNNFEGTKFVKYQWDLIHNPGITFNFLDKDGDADFIIVNNIEVLNPYRHSYGLTFVTPSGEPITISGNLQSVSFLSPIDQVIFEGSSYKNPVPIGTINEFSVLEGGITKKFQARFSQVGNTLNFVGFRNAASATEWYIDDKTKLLNKNNIKVLLGTPCFKNSIVKFRVFPTEYFTSTNALWPSSTVQQVVQQVKPKFFFDDYSNKESEGVDVFGNFDLADLNFTPSDFFLLDEVANSKDVCGKDAMYLFDVIYNVKQLASLGLCVKDGIQNASSIIENVVDSYENGPNPVNFNVSDASYIKKNIIPYGFEKINFFNQIGSFATTYEQITGKSKFELLADLITNYRNILESPIANNVSTTSLDDLLKFVDNTKSNGRMCLMKSFSISKRIDLIDRLSSATIPFSDRKENFIASLTETVPDGDYNLFITNLKQSNNQKFWNLYDDLHMSQYGRFMASLTSMIRQNDKLTIPDESQSAIEAKLMNGDFRNGTYHALTIGTNNWIAEISGNPKKIRIGSVLGRNFLGDPFEYILVKFENDFNFPNIQTGENFIKADTILKIPAFTLFWILDTKNTQETLTAVRVIVDVCIVTATVMSGGAASPLLVFDGIIAGADMAFAFADNSIDMSNNQELKDLRNGWNEMIAIIGATQAAGTLKYVTGRIARFSKNAFTNSIQTIKNSAVQIKNFRALLQRLVKDLSFDYGGRSIIAKILNNARLEAEINSFYRQIGTKSPSFFVEQDNLVLKLFSPTGSATTNISLGLINKNLSTGNSLYLENPIMYNKVIHGEKLQVLGTIINEETNPTTAYIFAKNGTGYSAGEFEIVETSSGKIVLAPKNINSFISFNDFLTINKKVKKAGEKGYDVFNSFKLNSNVPSRYTSNEIRFNALATDNATGPNVIDIKTRREAMAGLEAEKQGLISGPITREPTGDFEFKDANGKYWDVKGPPSVGMTSPSLIQIAGNSIKDQLTLPNVYVLLDCTWMTNDQLLDLRLWLNSNLTPSQLNRITEVNSNLF